MISSLELARLCGVSQGTVDRALHDRPGISAKTRARILDMARQHGYQPHPAARELLTGERTLVGAVVPSFNSVFFMDLMNAVRVRLAESGLRLFLAAYADEDECTATVEDFAARRAKGIIVIPPRDAMPLSPVVTRDTTVISLLTDCAGDGVCFLSPDEQQTGAMAVDYLREAGHERILHWTYARDARGIRDRRKGYELRCNDLGLPARIVDNTDGDALLAAVKRWRPTAIFAHNDWLALSAIRVLAASGVRVPDDLSVLGVDNSPAFVSICPDITTLEYPTGEIALAAQAILDGKKPQPIPNCRLVERNTVRVR